MKGVVVEKDGVKKINVLTADAVELGRHILDFSFTISGSQVCNSYLQPGVVITAYSVYSQFSIT